jgi:phage terminase small subunit
MEDTKKKVNKRKKPANLVSGKKKANVMTARQRLFCEYYIQSGNAAEAARKAGYSERSAKDIAFSNLEKDHIKKYIEKRLEDIRRKTCASTDEIYLMLTDIIRGYLEEENIVVEGVAEGVSMARKINTIPKIRDRIRASEVLLDKLEKLKESVNPTSSADDAISSLTNALKIRPVQEEPEESIDND